MVHNSCGDFVTSKSRLILCSRIGVPWVSVHHFLFGGRMETISSLGPFFRLFVGASDLLSSFHTLRGRTRVPPSHPSRPSCSKSLFPFLVRLAALRTSGLHPSSSLPSRLTYETDPDFRWDFRGSSLSPSQNISQWTRQRPISPSSGSGPFVDTR